MKNWSINEENMSNEENVLFLYESFIQKILHGFFLY